MAWLQLEFTVPANDIEVLEETLLEHGAAAITLLGDPEDLDPIVEPNPGETQSLVLPTSFLNGRSLPPNFDMVLPD